jgi:alpha-glucosidase
MKKVWWKHGVIYQIYPRSFKDSNNDGIGDINGITGSLDYLQDLDIDGIWLSPIYRSPMYDFGYDVSDYCDIDPVFGTMRDFKRLVKEAEKRNIAIIMDMVFNHTSHLHPWFLESRSSKDNPKRDWYIWHPGKKGKVPNNWMAAFGGRAWAWDPLTKEYYLHLFTKQQPDLNWRNPNVKKAMFDVLRFWMDNGVKGFRFDVINLLVKDRHFRNNPYKLRFTNPRRHDQQLHAYDRNQPETHDILKEMRILFDSYGAIMSVGEIYLDEGIRNSCLPASFLGNNDELHMNFNFSTMFASFDCIEFQRIMIDWYNAIGNKGWPCHVFSNHDQSRAITRIAKNDVQKAKLIAVLLLTQKGTPFIYYGEEIGMVDGNIPRKYIQDPVGKKYWPFHTGRDKARTPMQWNATNYAGFSTVTPWLPVNPDYTRTNVALQSKQTESMFQFYRKLIALRKSRKELYAGEIEFLLAPDDVMLYKRVWNNEKCIIALNFSSSKKVVNCNNKCRVLLSSYEKQIVDVQTITLDPFEAIICSQ